MDTSRDAMQTISTQRDAAKPFNSPVKPAGWPINDEGESYSSMVMGTAREDLETRQKSRTYLPEVQNRTWASQ